MPIPTGEPKEHAPDDREKEAIRGAWRLGGRAGAQQLANQLWCTLRSWCPECGGGGGARPTGKGEESPPAQPLAWCRTCWPWYPNDGGANARKDAGARGRTLRSPDAYNQERLAAHASPAALGRQMRGRRTGP